MKCMHEDQRSLVSGQGWWNTCVLRWDLWLGRIEGDLGRSMVVHATTRGFSIDIA